MKPKGSFTCIFSLAVTSSFLLLIHFPIATADGYINPKCAGGTYNTSSTFQTNLNALFTSLTSLSSTSNAANTTAGRAGDPNIVYGLYLCQGDLASSDCKSCVQTATTDVVQTCPDSRQATIWYDNCILRYSNLDFFGVPDSTGFNMTNPDQATSSPVPFEMVSDLVRVAPLQPRMFASNASVSAGLYGMAQCTSDLNSTGCSRCLNTILGYINTCCTKQNGWRYLAASCWVRYEATPFLKNLNNTYTAVIQYNCSGAADGARSRSSLDSVLNNATSRAQPTGFSTAVAAGSLYALALCRADLTTPSDVCSDCLDSAHSKFTDSCQNQTQGIMWFEKCMLRYSDQNFFGSVDYRGRTLCNTGKVTEQAYDDIIALASKLVVDAVNIPLMSAAGEVKTGSSNTTVGYVLVQCTRDLTSSACTSCLQTGIDSLANACKQINGWRYLSGSCTIRFETFTFYDTSALALETSPAATGGSPPTDDNLPSPPTDGGGKSTPVAAIVGPIAGALLVVSMVAGLYLSRRRLKNRGSRRHQLAELSEYLPYMDLATVQRATDNFSKENELGQGGFGSVYKGTQAGGREIAVKRLSAKSKQGDVEFKNEVKLIAKLQHRNLVKVLGYCDEREEKLLIYEYLPNKSLDFFLTDPTKRSMLDWQKRVIIVAGVARGLLYLHEDSTLKVIHRDLKASNVLLDKDMNAKISDFGMAKIYEADQSEANTNRVVGTFGYMAPEYAMDGIFSVKSDVYSFGVLLLEIISGKRNGRSHFEQHGQTLVRYAWQLWCDGNATQLMDELLTDTYTAEEATKYIHIGLLCVQDDAEARPTMSSVILMLRSEQMVLPQPTQPPTFVRRAASISDNSSSTTTNSTPAMSINQVTNTDLIPR